MRIGKKVTLLRMFHKTFYLGIRKKFTATVSSAFGKYLLVTNTVTCGGLMFVGDLLQQEIEYQRNLLPNRYDWARLARMTIVGLGYGPLHHYFYLGIHKFWPVANLKSITKKILADQFIMSPVCIVYFFYAAGLLEAKTVPECTDELSEKGLELYMVDWSVWPPVQFINFYFLPLQYQVLYINVITMLYNIFLSYIKHRVSTQNTVKSIET